MVGATPKAARAMEYLGKQAVVICPMPAQVMGVLSERCVDMESQGGSTNGLLEEGDGANDSHAGSIKGDLGEPGDWKEGSGLVVIFSKHFLILIERCAVGITPMFENDFGTSDKTRTWPAPPAGTLFTTPEPSHDHITGVSICIVLIQRIHHTAQAPTTCTPRVKQHYVYRQHQHLHLAQSTDNIQPVITTENAKADGRGGCQGYNAGTKRASRPDGTHWRKAAQLVWAQLGMVRTVVQHLPLAFEIPPHLIAIDMHMVDPAIIVAMQTWPPFNQMMTAREGRCDGGAYRAFVEGRAPGTAGGIRGRGKSWVRMRLKGLGFQTLRLRPLELRCRSREMKRIRTGRRHGAIASQDVAGPAAKPVDASDQTSRGRSQSRRPTKKAKPVDEDVQDRRDINNLPSLGSLFKGRGDKSEMQQKASRSRPRQQRSPEDTAGLPNHFNACCASSIDRSTSQTSKGTKLKSIRRSIQNNKLSFISWPTDWPPHGNYYSVMAIPVTRWTTTTGADDLCHCDEYREEVTILKRENADMRREIEVVDAIRNHLFLAPDVLNHPLVPFHATSNPTPVPHMPVMVELGTATSVVEVQSSRSGSRQESTEPPPASFEGGAGLEVPPSNVEPVHGPAGGPAISITPPPPAVGSAPEQEAGAIYSILSKCDLQEEVATAAGSCYCMLQILENNLHDGGFHGIVLASWRPLLDITRATIVVIHASLAWYWYQYIHTLWTCSWECWCCAGTHYDGAGMACMMESWNWGYAGIHGTGAGPASMALVLCQNTLQWHGFRDGFHSIGVVPEHITLQWCRNGLHDGPMALGMCRH
ncbi:hypothetical protein BKA82DRAFT_4019596 [Pisolithus tinctorius]|nr:hypothetical protein BKA82DRAFT_4019596 [Pisolithus tinctorius]